MKSGLDAMPPFLLDDLLNMFELDLAAPSAVHSFEKKILV